MTDRLDNRLKDWAARQTPHEAHLHRLAGEIRLKAVADRQAHLQATPIHAFRLRLGYALAGAAVATLVAVVLHNQHAIPGLGQGNGQGATCMAAITPEALQRGRRLFSEMERLFGSQLRWVAQSNGDVSLGIDAQEGTVDDSGLPTFVKLVVVAREGRQQTWYPVWESEVILRSEDPVEVVPKEDAVGRIALWVYPLSGGKIAVDTGLALTTPMKLVQQQHAVMAPGVPAEIVSIQQGGMEYRVLQTVDVLDGVYML